MIISQKQTAEDSGHEIIWLKGLQDELIEEGLCKHSTPDLCSSNLHYFDTAVSRLSMDLVDRFLIARLELSPEAMRCVSFSDYEILLR